MGKSMWLAKRLHHNMAEYGIHVLVKLHIVDLDRDAALHAFHQTAAAKAAQTERPAADLIGVADGANNVLGKGKVLTGIASDRERLPRSLPRHRSSPSHRNTAEYESQSRHVQSDKFADSNS